MTDANPESRRVPSVAVLAIHADQIRQHGGARGIRDRGLLASALQRAPNRWRDEESTDRHRLAALYGLGLSQNHPFVDGNKRTAFQAMYVFLGLNGLRIVAGETEVVSLMIGVAGNTIGEEDLTDWLRKHTQQR